MFQVLEQAQKNQNNPMDMLKEVTKNYTPEQMSGLFERAKQFGIPDNILEETQNKISKNQG